MTQSISEGAHLVGVIRVETLQGLNHQVRAVVPAEDTYRCVQLPWVAFGRPALAHFQGQIAPDHQTVNVCLEAFFKCPDARPGNGGILEQNAALLVQERGFLEMFLVKSDVKGAWRCAHVC